MDGLLNGGDLEITKEGFHPEFNLLIQTGKDLKKWPITDWIKNAEKKKKEHPKGPKAKFKTVFKSVDVTGNAASAKIELWKEDKIRYTDYLSLYKYPEGWKIVAKIYWDHTREN